MEDIYRSQFRLPYSLYEKMKAAAEKNRRSVNAELVARLEESFANQPVRRETEPDAPIATGPGAQELVQQLQELAKMFREAADSLQKKE